MVNISILQKPEAPWLIKTDAAASEILESLKKSLPTFDDKHFFILDGTKMKNIDGLYDEFINVLKFPDYFGRNYNALDECLCDLDWLDCSEYIIYINDSETIFSEEPSCADVLDGLLHILTIAGDSWSRPIELGEEWDRSAVPFHVIFQVKTNTNVRLSTLPILTIEER